MKTNSHLSELTESHFQNLGAQISKDIQRVYENHEKLVYNFLKFLFVLKDYESIINKILEKKFDFSYMNIISQKHHQNENYLKNLEKKLSENEQKTQKNQNLILQKRKTFKEDFVKPSNTHRNISFIPNSSQKPHNNNNVYAPKLNPTS